MAIATQLKQYLTQQGAQYELLTHPHSGSSMETAQAAHIPGDRLAKAVVVTDGTSYYVVAIPSDHHVDLGALHSHLQRPVGLATEADTRPLFPDCELGAIPPLGAAYGLQTLWDAALAQQPEVFLEAGDHELLLRIGVEEFQRLLGEAAQGHFSRHL
jgi:Ala-tRNA(Pro) deacylase